MLSTSGMVDTLLDGSVDDDNRVQKLTAIFFGLYLLMATQDIAVDGWYETYRSTPPDIVSNRKQTLTRAVLPHQRSLGSVASYFVDADVMLT